MRKRILIVSYHYQDGAEGRPQLVSDSLSFADRNKVVCLSADWDHINKRRVAAPLGRIALRVPSYFRNISLSRLYSYFIFALKTAKDRAARESDCIYLCVPDYISAVFVLLTRPRNQYVIVDVVDLWPEALPVDDHIGRFVKNLMLSVAKPFRCWIFSQADSVFFQSEYFSHFARIACRRWSILPMCCRGDAKIRFSEIHGEISFLFLGSMNSITDTRLIVNVCSKVIRSKPVRVLIIGGGDRASETISLLSEIGVVVENFGVTFDDKLKSQVVDRAHFGLNCYKQSTEVAVSYKSIEYFRAGLPIINSAKGDTWESVEEYGAGFNCCEESLEIVCRQICECSGGAYRHMCESARRLFCERHSFENFHNQLNNVVTGLLERPVDLVV